jgi:2-polyprenyl-3-methyl-5-hydroxy-6-metoxy-1,4-benzoquinol methylase
MIEKEAPLLSSLEKMVRRHSGQCPACLSTDYIPFARIPYYQTHLYKWGTSLEEYFNLVPSQFRFTVFDIHFCNACELMFVPTKYKGLVEAVENHPIFLSRVIKPYLDLTQKKVDRTYVDKIMKTDISNLSEFEKHQRQLVQSIYKHIRNRRKSHYHYLDIGCNIGGFAEIVRILFSDISVWGCETNTFYLRELQSRYPKLKIIQTSLDAENVVQKFDFVYASDVIEHIWDLDNFLLAIRKHLKPNGLIMFITPNVNCPESRKQVTNWWGFIVPHHAQLFCLGSLHGLMRRFGFKMIDAGYLKEEFWAVFCVEE